MITEKLPQLIGEALKARDQIRLSTLRMLSSSLNYEKISKQHDLSEEEELAVVTREVKKHKDSIEAYKSAGRQELVVSEEAELKILEEFMPSQMDESELSALIDQVISETGAGMAQMGRIIGETVKRAAGRADGGRISALVRERLTK